MFCSMSALALNKLNFKFDRFSVLFQLTYTQGEKKELGLDPGPLAKSCSGDEESDWMLSVTKAVNSVKFKSSFPTS